jgi:hypothetical protein
MLLFELILFIVYIFRLYGGVESLKTQKRDVFCKRTRENKTGDWTNFDDFQRLNFSCDLNDVMLYDKEINLTPSKLTKLTKQINIAESMDLKKFSGQITIKIALLNGIDLNNWSMPIVLTNRKIFNILIIQLSYLIFSYESIPINVTVCANQVMKSNYTGLGLFGSLRTLHFRADNYFAPQICPFIFRNTKVNTFKIDYLRNVSISRNYFRFFFSADDNRTLFPAAFRSRLSNLSSEISLLQLREFYNIQMNVDLLHPDVFSKTYFMEWANRSPSIQVA